MMYNNSKAVFESLIFKCIIAMKLNILYLLELEMSICQLLLCVHNWDFPQGNISFTVI